MGASTAHADLYILQSWACENTHDARNTVPQTIGHPTHAAGSKRPGPEVAGYNSTPIALRSDAEVDSGRAGWARPVPGGQVGQVGFVGCAPCMTTCLLSCRHASSSFITDACRRSLLYRCSRWWTGISVVWEVGSPQPCTLPCCSDDLVQTEADPSRSVASRAKWLQFTRVSRVSHASAVHATEELRAKL